MQKVALVTGSSSGIGLLTPIFGRLAVLLAKGFCRLRVILVRNWQGAVAD